jgi:hypothetical protein
VLRGAELAAVLGIGPRSHRSHGLAPWSADAERSKVGARIDEEAAALEAIVFDGLEVAMNRDGREALPKASA